MTELFDIAHLLNDLEGAQRKPILAIQAKE
jgi:hypothetical protein